MGSRRSAWAGCAAAIAMLSGCASIQVDVDVYKGALLNQRQIQIRQYAMLAASAKPVIQQIEDEVISGCRKGAPCANAKVFLQEVLERFDDHGEDLSNVTQCERRSSGQSREGCVKPAAERASVGAVSQRSWDGPSSGGKRIDGLDTLTRAVLTALIQKDEHPKEEVRRLNEAYIEFAERILRFVDSDNIFTNGNATDSFRLQRSMLQSLANTILIHANDLSRQDEREARGRRRAVIEQDAIARAFTVSPAEAFDRIVNRAVEQAARPPTAGSATKAVPTAAVKKKKEETADSAEPKAVDESGIDELARRDGVKKLLGGLRADVLRGVDASAAGDERRVHALLKQRLRAQGKGKLPVGSTVNDLDRARRAVDRVVPVAPVCSSDSGHAAGSGNGPCAAKSPIDVIDDLLADLRARRLHALAGDSAKAENWQKAIDAALEQRASLVYLRPTSDYLRSVHSASELQSANEPQYRNMLDDWMRYLKSSGEREKDEGRQRELEKLYWQNINRVTLGGGGQTNFVLAKDDVGNWYVKAYSADPQPVFQSAVNLGLFNAGARMNVNLLRRFQLQSKVDASSDKAERATLQEELDRLDAIDSRPLLKLKARYARQYESQTRDVTVAIQKRMSELPTTVAAAIDADKDNAGTCDLEAVKDGVEPLDTGDLATVLDEKPPATDTDAAVAERAAKLERASHGALEQLFRYAVSSSKAIVESKAKDCDASWLRSAASRLRAKVVGAAVDLAQQRKLSVERYEAALMNITDVALQK